MRLSNKGTNNVYRQYQSFIIKKLFQ